MTEMSADQRREAMRGALQNLSPNPAVAADQLRPAADDGDEDAIVLIAWILGPNQGRYEEGLRYAEEAVSRGYAIIALHYYNWLVGQPDKRPHALKMAQMLMDAGWSGIDPLGQMLPQVAQAGDVDELRRLLDVARVTPLPSRWTELKQDLDQAEPRLRQAVDNVEDSARGAVTAIADEVARVTTERARAEQLVAEVGSLVHEATAGQLAKEYAKQAEALERSAAGWTRWAIGVGVAAILVAAAAAIFVLVDNDSGAGAALTKFAFTIPVVVLAAYLGGLASSHRRMAWHWRHVELQIRTAEPFIANLEEERRKALHAVLALRLFPGQTLDPHGKSEDSGPSVNLTELITNLLLKDRQPSK